MLAGLILQVITSITATGSSSADQHFQIIEFSLDQLGKPSGFPYVWEYDHFVRPTLQVYMFSGYHLAMNALGLTDPYLQLTILRIILGIVMFIVFNLLAIHYFKDATRSIFLAVLLLVNFSWSLPYTRTLFCSEMMCSLFFFGTLLLYETKKENWRNFMFPVLVGFLFSLAFYFRFQVASALAGFGIWLIFFEKRYRHILPIAVGFAAGVILNIVLDYGYYKEWIFTPYAYYHVNINEGRATSFGTSSFMRYIGLIIFVSPAPLFSIILFYYSVRTFFKKYSNPIFLSVLLFIILHSLVGHKEERFMFPIFNVMPLIIGWSLPSLLDFYKRTYNWVRGLLRFLLWFTIVLNTILLLAITTVPYSQTIRFSEKLKNRFKGRQVELYTLGQTPFQTPSRNPMVFYKNGAPGLNITRLSTLDSIKMYDNRITWLTTTYNEIKDQRAVIDSLGYKPVMYSSGFLWNINEFLHKKQINTINEIWVLYRKD